ncbi:MAG: hypothetical protein AB1488_06310 [Nitrospirota bacterium]
MDIQEYVQKIVPKIDSPEKVYELFRSLGYQKDKLLDASYKRKIDEFEFAKEEREKVKDIYTVFNYDGKLQISLIEAKSLSVPLCSDRCLHRIFPKHHDYAYFAAILNSTLSWFLISLMGRAGLGQGALKYEAKDAKNLFVFDPLAFPSNKKQMLIKSFEKMGKRTIGNVYEELGINPARPIREQKPNPLPDRKALDDIVFDILGLTEDERNEVYWAVCELVKNRFEKARSV